MTSEVEMPEGAEILHVHGRQEGTLWALVDTSKPMEMRKIVSLETGELICATEIGKHIGTVFCAGQVYHLFDC